MLLLQRQKIIFEMVFNVVKNYQVILFKSILEQNTAVSLRGHTVRRESRANTVLHLKIYFLHHNLTGKKQNTCPGILLEKYL